METTKSTSTKSKSTITAEFTIAYTQFLDAVGKPTQPLPKFATKPDELIRLYKLMVLTRTFDTKAISLQRTGKLGTYASSLGQEAVAVGVGAAMHADDIFAPAYREYGVQLQRGVKMQDILAFWGGDERGSDFANKHDFPMCVPIASQYLHAAGAAKAMQLQGQSRAVVAVGGDGSTSQGDFYEAVNVSGAWNLPIVFVVCNNQWAISVPLRSQTRCQTLAQKAIAGGIPGEQVDGNDLIAVRNAVANAIEKARNNGGPSLIEAITYRLHDHTTADDAGRYRDESEVKEAWQRDPILRLRNYLKDLKAWSDDQEQELLTTSKQQVDAAVADYLQAKPQPTTAILDYLYESVPEAYQDQYQQLSTTKRSA